MKGTKASVQKADDWLDVVRKGLQFYVERGAIKNLKEFKSRGGKATFQFSWFYDHPMELHVDSQGDKLEFRNIFPNLTKKSEVYRELEQYVEALHSPKRPENERINRRKADCECALRSGSMSLVWTVKGKQHEYAVHRIVDLVHDVFQQARDTHFTYILENFNVPED